MCVTLALGVLAACDDRAGSGSGSPRDPGRLTPPAPTAEEPEPASAVNQSGDSGGGHVDRDPAQPPTQRTTPAGPVKPVDQDTPSIELRLELAGQMLVRGQFAQCRAVVMQVLSEQPSNGKARLFLALSYHKEKRYAQARPIYEELRRDRPDFPEFKTTPYYYGWCLYYLGELPEAQAAFEEHQKIQPNEGDTEFALGLIAFEQDRLDDAAAHFTRSIELQQDKPRRMPEVAKAHARLADVYIRRSEWEKAKAELLASTQMHPDHYIAYFKLSTVLRRLGEDDAAANALRTYNTFKEADERRRGIQNVPQHQE